MLRRISSAAIGSLLVLSACGGGSASTEQAGSARTKNAALDVDFGARWVGQKFAASTFKIANLPACEGVAAPANAAIVADANVAYLGWTASKSTPPTDETADMIVLERRAPSPSNAPWVVIGYTRTKANAIAPESPGKGAILRVSFYRSTSTPCIGPRSSEVRWVPNTTT